MLQVFAVPRPPHLSSVGFKWVETIVVWRWKWGGLVFVVNGLVWGGFIFFFTTLVWIGAGTSWASAH